MLLLSIGLLHLVNQLSSISNKKLVAPEPKCRNYQMWGLDYKAEGGLAELLADGITFLKVNGKIPMCSFELTFKGLSVYRNRKNCILHTEIYTQHKTLGRKGNDLSNRK